MTFHMSEAHEYNINSFSDMYFYTNKVHVTVWVKRRARFYMMGVGYKL